MTKKSEKSIGQIRKLVEEDRDIRKFMRLSDIEDVYSICRNKASVMAKKCGAFYKTGNVILIHVKRFEEYLESCRFTGEEKEDDEIKEDIEE